ncbi:MAG: hypothetical protein J7L08_03015 [Candidatus Aenigmarchaeota archaeon]|nr:hypothetical protein [Candidatus Aenigmarchaeota archaeon]
MKIFDFQDGRVGVTAAYGPVEAFTQRKSFTKTGLVRYAESLWSGFKTAFLFTKERAVGKKTSAQSVKMEMMLEFPGAAPFL